MPNNGTQQAKSGTDAPRKKRGRPPKKKAGTEPGVPFAESSRVPTDDVDVRLAKISGVRFGIDPKSGLYGLELSFSGSGWNCSAGGRYLVNLVSKEAKSELLASSMVVVGLLNAAKVAGVNELLSVPVEVTIINSSFDSFRILSEVL
jgi:hypothetical protein